MNKNVIGPTAYTALKVYLVFASVMAKTRGLYLLLQGAAVVHW